jgi:hypothetical protein
MRAWRRFLPISSSHCLSELSQSEALPNIPHHARQLARAIGHACKEAHQRITHVFRPVSNIILINRCRTQWLVMALGERVDRASECLLSESKRTAANCCSLISTDENPPKGTVVTQSKQTAYTKYWPPLALSVEPVMRPASSLARNTTQRATSSGSPSRPIGICGRMFFSSTSFGTACTISVLM